MADNQVILNPITNVVEVTQPLATIIEVQTPGPQGQTGPAGSPQPFTNISGSFETTSSLVVSGSITATQGFTGSLYGTASWAESASLATVAVTASYFSGSISNAVNAVSSSYAVTASFAENVGNTGSFVNTSSFNSLTQSFNNFTASYNTGSFTGSFTGSVFGTSSWAVSASQAVSSSYALSASFAATASSALNASDILIYVKNSTGIQINKGTVVRISGAVGDNPLIATASYTDDFNSANTLGITNENIANDRFGYVMTEGKLLGIDTSNFTVGQLLYLGATGSITGSAPLAPLHAVRLGQVLRVQLNNGSMYVRIDNGYELGELHDVLDTTTTSSYGDLLVKSGSIWISSKQLTGSYGLTGSLQATSFTGSLQGTASWAQSASQAISSSIAISSSYALTASFALNATAGTTTGSFVTTSSFNSFTSSINSFTSSYNSGSFTGSFTGSVLGTSSWAQSASQAISSSYAVTSSLPLQGIITASALNTTITFTKGDGSTFNVTLSQSGSVATASYAIFAETASLAPNYTTLTTFNNYTSSANSGSFTGSFTGSVLGTSSWAESASQAISSSYALSASFAPTDRTGSFTGSFTGSVLGTSSWANNAISSSYALTASYALNAGTTVDTGSFVTTSSFNAFTQSINNFTSSYNSGSFTGSFTGSVLGTSSWAVSASQAISSSYAFSASFAPTNTTGSFTGSFTGSLLGTSSWAQSSSQTISSSYALTASFALNATAGTTTGSFTGSFTGSGLFNTVTGSSFTGSFTGSFFGTSSWAQSASQAISASWAPSSPASLNFWSESLSIVSSISHSVWQPLGTGTNISTVLNPKGTGYISAQIPTGTTTGGNTRGPNAVDLQTVRVGGVGLATQVASGDSAVITGGRFNLSSGLASVVCGGRLNTAGSAQYTTVAGGDTNQAIVEGAFVGGGTGNTANGLRAAVAGGRGNNCNASYTWSPGGDNSNPYLYGMGAWSSGNFSTNGDNQTFTLHFWRSITGTGSAELFLDGSTTRAILLSTNTIWNGIINISAVCTGVGNGPSIVLGDVEATSYKVTIKRINTPSTSSIVGSVQEIGTTNSNTSMSTGVFTIDADTSNNALRLQYTPPNTGGGSTSTFRVNASFIGTQIRY